MVANVAGNSIVNDTLTAIRSYSTQKSSDMMNNNFELTKNVVGNNLNLNNGNVNSAGTNAITAAVKGTLFDIIV